jgi:hypothetical protein
VTTRGDVSGLQHRSGIPRPLPFRGAQTEGEQHGNTDDGDRRVPTSSLLAEIEEVGSWDPSNRVDEFIGETMAVYQDQGATMARNGEVQP